jgi:DNA-binding MarR family transcriptional regulator
MSDTVLPFSATLEVRDRCLCFRAQRAARALARRFDAALRPHGLTSGQFSILMALNRPEPPRIGQLADFLAMDRTTLTAALKPLERQGLVDVARDPSDGRNRRPVLTGEGRRRLARALPDWRRTHDLLDASLAAEAPEDLRRLLETLA